MKKILIKILIFALAFSSLTFAVFHDHEDEEEHDHLHIHVYEIDAADFGRCPTCGEPRNGSVIAEPTCTSEGAAEVWCEVMGCMEWGNAYMVSIPALGHDYTSAVTKEATCTGQGNIHYSCSRCGNTYDEAIAALGHNYQSRVTKEATCEEDGIRTYTCTRCSDSYRRTIKALGHDVELETKEATCEEDGYQKGTCKRCGKVFDEVYPALGHDLAYTVTKTPTCEEEGEREAVCSRCGEKFTEKILPAGHKYPNEWTLEKEPTYFETGLETKKCFYCEHVLSHILPKKDLTPVIAGGAGILAVLGGLWVWLKKVKASKVIKKAAEEIRKFEKPSFEDKSILVASKDEDLMNVLKSKSFLEVSSCDNTEVEEKTEEDGPDLVIVDVLSEERLEKLLEQKKEALAEQAVAVVTTDEMIKHHKRKLNNLVKDRKIVNYLPYGSEKNAILMKFVLPILKPDIKSDESLSNIGAIADFIGIPAVSKIIDVYTSGRDIKSTLESEEIGVSEAATIIGDIASILGLDGLSSAVGLVDDVDSLKSVLDKEAGAYERKNAVDGAKDIAEVVTDIINKD